MKMDIQIERRAKALDQDDGTHPGRVVCTACFPHQIRGDDTVDDTQHQPHDLGSSGEQEAQLKGKAEYPLAHGLFGQNFIYQQGCAFGSGSCFALPPASMQSSAIRRVPQLGQKPRRLQLKPIRRSA